MNTTNDTSIQDVFKLSKIFEHLKNGQPSPISIHLDKLFKEKALCIINDKDTFAEFPKSKFINSNLHLKGKYLVIQLKEIPYNEFDLIFFISNSNNVPITLSISTNTSIVEIQGTNLKIPIYHCNKWININIEMKHLFNYFIPFLKVKTNELIIKSLKVYGSLLLKSIFSTDSEYTFESLPKQYSFLNSSDKEWQTCIDWIDIPDSLIKYHEENEYFRKVESNQSSNEFFEEDFASQSLNSLENQNNECVIQKNSNNDNSQNNNLYEDQNLNFVTHENEKNIPKINNIKELSITGKSIIKMKLNKIVPYIGKECNDLLLIRIKNSPKIVFSSYNLIIFQNIFNGKQKHIFCSGIIRRLFSIDGCVIAINNESDVNICDNNSKEIIMKLTLPITQFSSIEESTDKKYILIAGKDKLKRDLVLLVDKYELKMNKKVVIKNRKISSKIIKLKASFQDPSILISCSEIDFTLWKIHNGKIESKIYKLKTSLEEARFTNILLESQNYDFIYATTDTGLLYKFLGYKFLIEEIRQIHNGGISGILFIRDFAYITCGLDRQILIWNLSFSDIVLSFQTESPILSMNIEENFKVVVVMLKDGTIGKFNIDSQQFNVLCRSNLGKIIDIDYCHYNDTIASSNSDHSIKVWNCSNFEQIAQFDYCELNCICIACAFNSPLCAVGFENGILKIIDIKEICQKFEISLSTLPIRIIKFSESSTFLAIEDDNGIITIFNSENLNFEATIRTFNCNPNYLDICFSRWKKEMLIIGNNSNNIQIFETESFKNIEKIDLDGDFIVKMKYYDNDQGIIVLTASSNILLFIYEQHVWCLKKKYFKIHSSLCTTFTLDNGSNFLFTGGKDCQIKIRKISIQGNEDKDEENSYLGHFTHIRKLIVPKDNKKLLSYGEDNNIFSWDFF